MKARRATLADADAIYRLIALYAEEGLLLPRSEEEIACNIGNFLVLRNKDGVAGCVALESYGPDLAEIRSLAVSPELRERGVGARLTKFAIKEARRRRIARLFAVTSAPEFFLRQGFASAPRQSLIEKIERDCRACPKRRSCNLVAVVANVLPSPLPLPILNDSLVTVQA
ncbi:MAG: GNAT family N-acetyltransferase [Candidatus Acidiferrales bacterium]